VGTEVDVVAGQRRRFVAEDRAADVRQDADVVRGGELLLRQAETLAQPHAEPRRPQHVLLVLAALAFYNSSTDGLAAKEPTMPTLVIERIVPGAGQMDAAAPASVAARSTSCKPPDDPTTAEVVRPPPTATMPAGARTKGAPHE